ncbi:hypothetical protein R3P38DRAFT_2890173 [Favolaschia claudopus]|uniref:Fungal-type protein kinase domain-containing protein n=1 Tax=Favolaschia claudopus TaxID=2862362 RepID=A0AAW0CTF3_9AGAR
MDVPDLLSTLFPDACLPLPAADILAKLSNGSSTLYIDRKGKFCPDLAKLDVENDVADFFNHFAFVIENICAAAGRPQPKGRRGTAKFVDHGVENAPNVRKPEFFLGSEANLDWPNTSNHDPAVRGYDPTIVETAPGVRHIEVKGRKYDIVGSNALFICEGIRGRGTVCWRVCHGGKEFVIKDTWDDDARPNTEAQILDIAMSYGVVGIPQVEASEIVDVGGIKGTDALRSSLPSDIYEEECAHIEKRLHCRLVLAPFGHALHTFSTRKELLSASRDAIEAHQILYDKAKILHRDISANNILLIPSAQMPPPRSASPLSPDAVGASSVHTATPNLRRGLLIDVNRALVLGSTGEHKTAPAHRIVRTPNVCKTLPQHLPRHDLESFLYVLIWICVHYAGPNGVVRQNFKIYDSWLKDWVGGTSYKSIGGCKGYSILADDAWEEVLNCFAPYFEPLKTCATVWRKLFRDKQLNYKEVSHVLQTAIDLLDDSETWSSKDDPAGYGAWNLNKRKRQVEANLALGGSIAKEDHDVFNDHGPPLKFLQSDGSPERVPVARSVPELRARKSIKNGLKPNHRRMLSMG